MRLLSLAALVGLGVSLGACATSESHQSAYASSDLCADMVKPGSALAADIEASQSFCNRGKEDNGVMVTTLTGGGNTAGHEFMLLVSRLDPGAQVNTEPQLSGSRNDIVLTDLQTPMPVQFGGSQVIGQIFKLENNKTLITYGCIYATTQADSIRPAEAFACRRADPGLLALPVAMGVVPKDFEALNP